MKYNRIHNGFTLLEVVFASTVFAVLMGMTSMAMRASMLSVEMTSNQADAESKAAAAMDLMARELKDGGTKYANFSMDSSQQVITFARCNGYANGNPVFGNQITYAFVTYGSLNCLERTEIINGLPMKQILTDQLSNVPVSVTTAQGIKVTVTGVNFQILSSDVVTITLAVRKSNHLMKENSTLTDDNLIVTSQCSVPLSND